MRQFISTRREMDRSSARHLIMYEIFLLLIFLLMLVVWSMVAQYVKSRFTFAIYLIDILIPPIHRSRGLEIHFYFRSASLIAFIDCGALCVTAVCTKNCIKMAHQLIA